MLELFAAITKTVLYGGALSGAGSALARASLAPLAAQNPVRLIARCAGSMLAIAAVASAVLLVVRLGNYWDIGTLAAIFLSPLGLALACLFVGGAWLASDAPPIAGLVAALLIILAFAISGHAAARNAPLAIVMAIHVAAAAWWVGGLWVLLRASKTEEGAAFAGLVRRFSSHALWIVGALVAAGIVAAAFLLQFKFDFARDYDRGLALKIGFACALLAVAAFNKFLLMPGLEHRLTAQPAMRRSIIGELSLVACIVAATASLTTFTSPHERAPPPDETIVVSGPIEIIDPWAAPTPRGMDTGGGYLSIVNRQDVEDSLISVSSPRAARVSLHEMNMDGGVMRMRSLEEIPIAPGQRLDLTAGSYHLMFEEIDAPFLEGESVEVTLTFRESGDVSLAFPVRRFAQHAH